MQPSPTAPAQTPPVSTEDIVFVCIHCSTSLVVDAAAAGMTVECQSCRQPTRVPDGNSERAARISDLQRQLKENDSQRTEITSYIHQHSIQLHRWQLRLNELNDRKAKLDGELSAIVNASR